MNLLGGLDEDEVSHGCLLRANVLEKKLGYFVLLLWQFSSSFHRGYEHEN